MAVALATFHRTWVVTRRAYPWTYFVGTVLTGALTIGLAYLAFHAVGGGQVADDFADKAGTSDYLAFVAVGATANTFVVRLLLWAAKALITEQREGTLAALIVAPARRLPYLVGFAAFAVTSTFAEVAALWGFARVLGISLPATNLAAAVVATGVITAAVFAVSIPLGAVMIAAGEAHISQNTVFYLMAVLCGFVFPRAYLPEPAQWLAELIPVTAALDVVRGAFAHGQSPAELAPRIAAALAVSTAYALFGLWLMPRAERRAMERTN